MRARCAARRGNTDISLDYEADMFMLRNVELQFDLNNCFDSALSPSRRVRLGFHDISFLSPAFSARCS
jgi:hypothetical protein